MVCSLLAALSNGELALASQSQTLAIIGKVEPRRHRRHAHDQVVLSPEFDRHVEIDGLRAAVAYRRVMVRRFDVQSTDHLLRGVEELEGIMHSVLVQPFAGRRCYIGWTWPQAGAESAYEFVPNYWPLFRKRLPAKSHLSEVA